MAENRRPDSKFVRYGKLTIFALLFCLAGVVILRYMKANGGLTSGKGDWTNIPEEIRVNYRDADFTFQVDEDDAMAILSNPKRYRREFNQLVHDLNTAILGHVAERMSLNESQRSQVLSEYEQHHPYLRNLYYQDFLSLKDTTSTIYQTWYDNESSSAVETLHEIASRYTCYLVNHIVTTVVPTEDGAFFAKGRAVGTPCGIALDEALKPFMARMSDRAAIADFGKSRGLLQEKVERVIAELATMEVQDKKGITKKMQTKIWGMNVSSSDLDITAISILKVGFDLNQYFDIQLNAKNKMVTITLPEPKILSHEVYPRIDKLDIGWLREVESVDFNENFNLLRTEFRREALESDVMEKSKKQAIELMNTMFDPVVKSMSRKYQVRVKFQEGDRDPAFAPEDDFTAVN